MLGWSKPPPADYVTTNAILYEEYYGEFFKQWHHAMRITNCEDPRFDWYAGGSLQYPTNSYYPPGIVCAVEIHGEFCPTSGESGSPLMVTDQKGRMVAEGINSFIKVFHFFVISFVFLFYEANLKRHIYLKPSPRAVLTFISN